MSTCEKCGEELDGLMAHVNHRCPCAPVLERMSEGEIRTAFIEMGMPTMGFEAMHFAPPTEMERQIFEEEKPEPVIYLHTTPEMHKRLDKWLRDFSESQNDPET